MDDKIRKAAALGRMLNEWALKYGIDQIYEEMVKLWASLFDEIEAAGLIDDYQHICLYGE